MTGSSLRLSQNLKLDTLAAIFVTLAPLAYFHAAVRGTISLASEDGILFNVPLRVAAANILRDGHLPLWNPYIFSGMPLHASAQGGLLFPLNWFYLFFDAPTATSLMALSTYMLAALGAYLYALRSGSSVSGAVVTSLIWQWCGFLVGQFSHVNIVQTAALLPWLLWAVDGYGVRGDRKWGLVLAAVVMLQAFTGHQQTLVYSLLLAAAYAVVMWRAARPVRNWYLWSLVLLAVGMLLAAVQILPTYELMRNSLRSRASFDFFTAFSLPPKFLLTFFAPYLMGGGDGRLFRVTYFGAPFYGEFIGYVGLGALMLATLAIVLKRDARTKFWAAVMIIAFVLALGHYWPLKLYGIIYYLPILNLFRVPARHMMEVDLALAVLAGRGLTALAAATDRKRSTRLALAIGSMIFLLTCLVVTLARPAAFRLAREAPITLLRAPELFLPLVFAALSAWALWRYARARSAAVLCLLMAVIALDLCVWGQSSGWRVASPAPDSQFWDEPPPLKHLPRRKERDAAPYRILTTPHGFNPNEQVIGPMTSHSTDWVLWLQPDLYMMHGVENAAGYDGFGLARYSRLAGDMTVWGELPDPDRTLRGEGRELDLLNVRYLLAMTARQANGQESPRPVKSDSTAVENIAGHLFAAEDLNAPLLDKGGHFSFNVPPTEMNSLGLLTNLSWSVDVPDGTPVGHVRLREENGHTFDFDLLAGVHTSEWAYDRADIRRSIRHKRAPIGMSYTVEDAQGKYEAHSYVAMLALPEKVVITSGEISVAAPTKQAPDLGLKVLRVTLESSQPDRAVALRREWLEKAQASSERTRSQQTEETNEHWRPLVGVGDVAIFENTRMLPRAWLATDELVATEQDQIDVIRSGKLPNGQLWDPLHTALVEAPTGSNFDGDATPDSAEVTLHEPNRVMVKTTSEVPAILVLSENDYPGWRAYIDGRVVKTLRVNYNLRGVALPAGNHVVSFVYFPKSVLIGLLTSLFAASGLMFWYFRLWQQVRLLFTHGRGERI
ncbi:MAG: YfhO family protein [Pyrinomonadaceae bacterium]